MRSSITLATLGAILILPTNVTAQGGEMPLPDMNQLMRDVRTSGVLNEGVAAAKQALSIAESVWGIEHPDSVDAANNLGQNYLSSGQYHEAEEIFARLLNLRFVQLQFQLEYLAALYANLGRAYLGQGRDEEAGTMFDTAAQMYEEEGKADSSPARRVQNELRELHR